MKKILMMMALMAMSFAMQAQTKFHDVELNEAKGAVKKISQSIMGMEQVINFTQDGKMQREGMTNAKYDAEGYLQSATMSVRGQEVNVSFKWENGKVVGTTVEAMGQKISSTRTFNDKGATDKETVNVGGQTMETPYTDYKYDDKGNWISRKSSMMGQTMEQTRTIEYFN